MTPALKELTRRLRETPPNVLKEREAAAAILSLIAELEQCRKDEERLDWLSACDSSHGFCHTMYGEYRFYAHQMEGYPTVRQVIDAAIAKESA